MSKWVEEIDKKIAELQESAFATRIKQIKTLAWQHEDYEIYGLLDELLEVYGTNNNLQKTIIKEMESYGYEVVVTYPEPKLSIDRSGLHIALDLENIKVRITRVLYEV